MLHKGKIFHPIVPLEFNLKHLFLFTYRISVKIIKYICISKAFIQYKILTKELHRSSAVSLFTMLQ